MNNKRENILYTFWGYVRQYFTLRPMRVVFFFSLLAVFFAAVAVNLIGGGFILKVFLGACAFSCLSTMVDSVQAKSEFTGIIASMEHKNRRVHNRRSVNKPLDFETDESVAAFGADEVSYIKRKKREFNYLIVIKLIFMIFFIALLM